MTRTPAQDRAAYGVEPRPEAELAFQSWVTGMADLLGWLWFHDTDPLLDVAGFPDLVLAHEAAGRLVWAELKSETGRLSPAQRRWRAAIEAGGGEYHLWRPSQRRDVLAVLDWERRGIEVSA